MNNLYPSLQLQDKLASLTETATHDLSVLKDLSIADIVEKFKKHEGEVRLVKSGKGTTSEWEKIEEAIAKFPAEKVRFIVIPGEDELLQALTAEILEQPALWHYFVVQLWLDSSDHFVKEYVEFISGHDKAKLAKHPRETHHPANMGLDANHELLLSLETKLMDAIPQVLKEKIESLDEQLVGHEYFRTSLFKTWALKQAMCSNFIRGGAFYGFSNPSKVESYFPRKVAFLCIKEWNAAVITGGDPTILLEKALQKLSEQK